MTHANPLSESDGKFTSSKNTSRKCSTCGGPMVCQTWESSDGAFEDYKYTCMNAKCMRVEWVDGIDS
jgi:hypothetical protein